MPQTRILKGTKLGVSLILGDSIFAGLSTLNSLVSQSILPLNLFVLENPQKKVRLSTQFPHVFSMLAWLEEQGVTCTWRTTQSLSMVQARIECEQALGDMDLFMISDGDHFYPPDYLELASQALVKASNSGFFGGAVDFYSSISGLSSSWLPVATQTEDYVAGGSFVYTKEHVGLWKEVLEYTDGLGEDRCWRALCFRDGGRKVGVYDSGAICHLATHSSTRYPKSQSAKLINLCSRYLGTKTARPDLD